MKTHGFYPEMVAWNIFSLLRKTRGDSLALAPATHWDWRLHRNHQVLQPIDVMHRLLNIHEFTVTCNLSASTKD